MRLRFAHLADFVTVDADGKLTIVGAFDRMRVGGASSPYLLSAFRVVASFEASLSEGASHAFACCVVDDDEDTVISEFGGPIQFATSGVGHPIHATAIIEIAQGTMTLPHLGDYYVCFRVDGIELGRVRLTLVGVAGLG
jgi:hypothetical protein